MITDPRRVANRAGWKDKDYFYIQTDVWNNEVQKGADAKLSAKHLKTAGLLKTDSDDRLQYRIKVGVNRPRVYAVEKAILEINDD